MFSPVGFAGFNFRGPFLPDTEPVLLIGSFFVSYPVGPVLYCTILLFLVRLLQLITRVAERVG